MRQRHYTITRHDVHRSTLDRLTTYLRLPDHSRRCPAATVFQVVRAAAARLCSIAAAAHRRATAPSDQTIRNALAGGLPERPELERRINRAFAADRPRSLAGTRQPLALDLTLQPYHGQPFRDPAGVYRSRATHGTSHFPAYATVYLARHGRRFTLALTWVTKGEPLAGVIQRLLRVARRHGIRPRYLLLDRGFCSVDVVRSLPHGRHPFLMPLPRRGRRGGPPSGRAGATASGRRTAPPAGSGRRRRCRSRGPEAAAAVGCPAARSGAAAA